MVFFELYTELFYFVVLIFFGSVDEEDEYIFTTKDAGRELYGRDCEVIQCRVYTRPYCIIGKCHKVVNNGSMDV